MFFISKINTKLINGGEFLLSNFYTIVCNSSYFLILILLHVNIKKHGAKGYGWHVEYCIQWVSVRCGSWADSGSQAIKQSINQFFKIQICIRYFIFYLNNSSKVCVIGFSKISIVLSIVSFSKGAFSMSNRLHPILKWEPEQWTWKGKWRSKENS